MRDLFPGYFKPNNEEIQSIWNNCLFVFDASILLNLYRYSESTKSEFLRIMDKIQENIWIPNRVAEEFLKNRLNVIDKQEAAYSESLKKISTLKEELEDNRRHPFIADPVLTKANSLFEILIAELEKNRSVHCKRTNEDEIKDTLETIFNGRIGKPYSEENLNNLIKTGEERYKQKIPPGYKDSNKKVDTEIFQEKCRIFGDLIIWEQIINHSKDSESNIIFVTDDRKEDWWQVHNGKTVGPRPELIEEFKKRTNKNILMYQADKFLERARENLQEAVSEEIVNEVRELRETSKSERIENQLGRYAVFSDMHNILLSHLREIDKELNFVENDISSKKNEVAIIGRMLESLVEQSKDSDDFKYEDLANKFYFANQNLDKLIASRNALRLDRIETEKSLSDLENKLKNN